MSRMVTGKISAWLARGIEERFLRCAGRLVRGRTRGKSVGLLRSRRRRAGGMTVQEFVALVALALITTFVYFASSLFIFAVRVLASKGARTFVSLSK